MENTQETIPFEPGVYRIRGGNEAHLLWTDGFHMIGFYYILDPNNTRIPMPIRWDSKGYFREGDFTNPLDLVREDA